MKDQELYRVPGGEKAKRLKTEIPRELDLTYLNHERLAKSVRSWRGSSGGTSSRTASSHPSIPDELGINYLSRTRCKHHFPEGFFGLGSEGYQAVRLGLDVVAFCINYEAEDS
jgi:hypothetical protein